MESIRWNEQFKLRTVDCNKSRDKHEIIKLLLMRKLIRKHKNEKKYIKIYTEFEVEEGIICDVYYENYKTKEKYAFEIQKDMSNGILKKKIEKYGEWTDYFSTTDVIFINLNNLSNNIKELEEELEEFVV